MGEGIDGSVLGWTVGSLALAALVGIGLAVEVWRFGRSCLTGDCCDHAEAGE